MLVVEISLILISRSIGLVLSVEAAKRAHEHGRGTIFRHNHSHGTSQIMTLEIDAMFPFFLGVPHERRSERDYGKPVSTRTRNARTPACNASRSLPSRREAFVPSTRERSCDTCQLGDILETNPHSSPRRMTYKNQSTSSSLSSSSRIDRRGTK